MLVYGLGSQGMLLGELGVPVGLESTEPSTEPSPPPQETEAGGGGGGGGGGTPWYERKWHPLKSSVLEEEYLLVQEAMITHEQEIEARHMEDKSRRDARRIEQAKQHLRQLEKGASMEDADYYIERRQAFTNINRSKKEYIQRAVDEKALQNKIKMARLRAKRKKK